MSRALALARAALEGSGDVGLAVVASAVALRWLWWHRQARMEQPQP